MKNKFKGDSVNFFSVLKDEDGDLISTGTAKLIVRDYAGTAVVNLTATNAGSGTYVHTDNSASWSLGPIVSRWVFTGAFGTISETNTNDIKIVGTTEYNTYVSSSELVTYFERISDYEQDELNAKTLEAYTYINDRLRNYGIKTPVPFKADGYADTTLRDANAYEAIFRIVSSREITTVRNEEKPWFDWFKERVNEFFKNVEKGNIRFNQDTASGDTGISRTVIGTNVGDGRIEVNWQSGYMDDSEFHRDWLIVCSGTGNNGRIDEGQFTWSKTNGLIVDGTFTTDMDWQTLENGVAVRATFGTSGTNAGLWAIGDRYAFTTTPNNLIKKQGKQAVSY